MQNKTTENLSYIAPSRYNVGCARDTRKSQLADPPSAVKKKAKTCGGKLPSASLSMRAILEKSTYLGLIVVQVAYRAIVRQMQDYPGENRKIYAVVQSRLDSGGIGEADVPIRNARFGRP
jgi:hypothetical protein